MKDIFIKYLEETFNESYKTIGRDVKVRNGNKDLDYLLESNDGKTIALEITSVTINALNKESPGARRSKFLIFENFFKDLLDDGKDLPAIIFTILEPEDVVVEGSKEITKKKIKKVLNDNSQQLKDEISKQILGLPLYDKYNINLAKGIHFSIERGLGNNRLQFNPYKSHMSMIEFDPDRYEYSEEYKVYEQLKNVIPKKNASLDYEADKRIILVQDGRETLGTTQTLKYGMKRFITDFPSYLTNVDEIFVCCWNYEEQEVIFDKIYP